MTQDRWLVIGLGNPGREYAGNRHNAGFMILDMLADRVGARFRPQKTRAQVIEARLADVPVVLAKPSCYMNVSGGPVTALRDFFKIPPERIVVAHDELDIPYGTLRLKLGGGDNGHNGVRSVTRSLRTPGYFRVRFGIGRPPGSMDPAAYVLRDFSVSERKDLDSYLSRAADAVEVLVADGLAVAQNAYH